MSSPVAGVDRQVVALGEDALQERDHVVRRAAARLRDDDRGVAAGRLVGAAGRDVEAVGDAVDAVDRDAVGRAVRRLERVRDDLGERLAVDDLRDLLRAVDRDPVAEVEREVLDDGPLRSSIVNESPPPRPSSSTCSKPVDGLVDAVDDDAQVVAGLADLDACRRCRSGGARGGRRRRAVARRRPGSSASTDRR